MKSVLFFFIILISNCSTSFANQLCHPPITLDIIRSHVTQIRDSYFSNEEFDLTDTEITFKTFNSDSVYLKTNGYKYFKRGKKQTTHQILVNNNFLECPPSPEGLQAIVAHELFHIHDYRNIKRRKLIPKYLFKQIKYEHKTDLKVLQVGLGVGLIDYRNWIYQKISNLPKKKVSRVLETDKEYERRIKRLLKIKKASYYTPEEIVDWIKINN
jgi:hypothetical protein